MEESNTRRKNVKLVIDARSIGLIVTLISFVVGASTTYLQLYISSKQSELLDKITAEFLTKEIGIAMISRLEARVTKLEDKLNSDRLR